MRKILIGVVLAIFLVGCSPTLTIKPDGTITATNYAVVQGVNSYIPKPLISTGFADSIVQLAGSLGSKVVSTGTAIIAPTPAPVPQPSPSPVIVPTPPPVVTPPQPIGYPKEIVVADMDQIPGQMRQAGFAGRDTALWYSLSRLIAWGDFGYKDDGELTALHNQKDDMQRWWGNRVEGIIADMRSNPQLTTTIVTNDGPDKCGQQLSLGTMRMFPADLQPRVKLGNTVPD